MEALRHLPSPLPDAQGRLDALERVVHADIEVLKYPSVPLPYPHRTDALEVAVVGGGQTGKCMAFGLRRHGCHNVKVFDRNPKGSAGTVAHLWPQPRSAHEQRFRRRA